MSLEKFIKNLEKCGLNVPELSKEPPHVGLIGQNSFPLMGLSNHFSVGIDGKIKDTNLESNIKVRPGRVYIIYKGIYQLDERGVEMQGDIHAYPFFYVAEKIIIDSLKKYVDTLHPSQISDINHPFAQGTPELHDVRAGIVFGGFVSAGRIRWFDHMGESFPYVLAISSIIGDIGVPKGGLYFVSADVARRKWQQEVVAIHERYCQTHGHEFAIAKEIELLDVLKISRKSYDNWINFINRRYASR